MPHWTEYSCGATVNESGGDRDFAQSLSTACLSCPASKYLSNQGGVTMLKKSLAIVLFLGIVFPLAAAADDTVARFKGATGVIPVSSGVGLAPQSTVVNRNIVRDV